MGNASIAHEFSVRWRSNRVTHSKRPPCNLNYYTNALYLCVNFQFAHCRTHFCFVNISIVWLLWGSELFPFISIIQAPSTFYNWARVRFLSRSRKNLLKCECVHLMKSIMRSHLNWLFGKRLIKSLTWLHVDNKQSQFSFENRREKYKTYRYRHRRKWSIFRDKEIPLYKIVVYNINMCAIHK